MKNKKKNGRKRKTSGITLIALVVTIIVLLLLAGVSITMLTGNNNLVNQAGKAKEETQKASKEEQRQLAQMEANMNTNETEYLGVKIPAGYAPTKIEGENTLEDGLVITDGAGNEYVWIEVPNDGSGPDYTAYKASNNVADIEEALHTYANAYRNGTAFKDEYYSDATTGLTEGEYNKLKEKMLKSIYENGGFYIGRYETGIEISEKFRDYGTDYSTEHPTTQKPVIKANAYPYNWVRCSQAEKLAEQLKPSGEKYTASLMFGVQWDLVLRYLESKGATIKELNEDSTEWGNYNNKTYNIQDANVKYSSDNGKNWTFAPCNKTSSSNILLTTGASNEFNKQNIYDIAGNVREWTLEYTSNTSSPCTCRGGSYDNNGSADPTSRRYSYIRIDSFYSIGFRVSLY